MNKEIHKLIPAMALLMSVAAANAQTAVATSGGITSGNAGTVSFTVGQPFVEPFASEKGSVAPGVQQAYIITTVGVDDMAADITLEAYPNPVADCLTLRVAEVQSTLRYTLTDANGRTLAADNMADAQTAIEMASQPAGVYFLRVDDGQNMIKTFKIVKN